MYASLSTCSKHQIFDTAVDFHDMMIPKFVKIPDLLIKPKSASKHHFCDAGSKLAYISHSKKGDHILNKYQKFLQWLIFKGHVQFTK